MSLSCYSFSRILHWLVWLIVRAVFLIRVWNVLYSFLIFIHLDDGPVFTTDIWRLSSTAPVLLWNTTQFTLTWLHSAKASQDTLYTALSRYPALSKSNYSGLDKQKTPTTPLLIEYRTMMSSKKAHTKTFQWLPPLWEWKSVVQKGP